MGSRPGRGLLLGLLVVTVAASACSGSAHQVASKTSNSVAAPASTTAGAVGAGITVTGLPASEKIAATDLGPQTPLGDGMGFVSDGYSLTPSGPLSGPAQVTMPLTTPLQPGSPVIVATKEQASDPWDYLAAILSDDGKSVTFTTRSFLNLRITVP